MVKVVPRPLAALVFAAAVLLSAFALTARADNAAAANFEIQFDNGQMSLGGLGTIPLGTGSSTITTFTGTTTGENVTVPQANFDLPSFAVDQDPISASVALLANGNGTGKYYPATGQFNVKASLALNLTVNNVGEIIALIPPELLGEYGSLISLLAGLDRISCSLSPLVLDFSTEATTPFAGKRFVDGFDGDGAVAATWEETPPITGGVPSQGGLAGIIEKAALNFICPLIAETAGLDSAIPDSEGSIQLSRGVMDEPTPEYTLTTNTTGDGSGQLSASPQPVGGTYTEGTVVTVTPTADAGSTFAGWEGCDYTEEDDCIVTVDDNKTVTATFDPIPPEEYVLTVNTSGEGSGSVSADPEPVGGTYTDGTTVTLTATPDSGSTFEGWTGCDSVDGNECAITINGDATVTAEFGLEVVDPSVPFNLVLNHGVVSVGSAGVDSSVTGLVSLEGTWDSVSGVVTVPSVNVSDISAALPGVEGLVTFRPNGTHLTGTWNPSNGKLTVRGPFRASFSVGGLNCHATQNLSFSSDKTDPFKGTGVGGTRFTSGLERQGAIAAFWDGLSNIRGDAGCAAFAPQLNTAGGIWLSHDIESPFPPAPVGPLELTPPTLIDSSGELATEITPGRRLICVAGTWSNVTRGTFAWTKNDAPFSNLKADGAGSDVYRPTAGDIGSTFSCHQVMRNAEVKDVAGSSSNSAVVVVHGG